MPPEDKKLLEDTHKLAQDNNNMLHSMRRSMRISQVVSFVYWMVIIGSAVGAYYFVQPYIDQITAMYQSASNVLRGVK